MFIIITKIIIMLRTSIVIILLKKFCDFMILPYLSILFLLTGKKNSKNIA